VTIEDQIDAAVARQSSRIGFVPIYRAGLLKKDAGEVLDWKRINAAILTRFKRSGLAWIRDKAWCQPAKVETPA